jgi:predicted O-methyltransferase YrrM
MLGFQERQFPKHPFGRVPLADLETYLRLHENASSDIFPELDRYEEQNGFAVGAEWLNNLALHTQVVVKTSELNWQHGRILYTALRKRIQRGLASSEKLAQFAVFETGTARGFSAVCMAKALVDASQPGNVITLDILPHNAPMFWNCVDDLERPKTRQELLEPWPEELSRVTFFQAWTGRFTKSVGVSRIHFAFLDAQHTQAAVSEEYKYVRDRQKKGDVIVFDDVSVSTFDGVVRAVDEVEREGLYFIERITGSGARGYAIAERL